MELPLDVGIHGFPLYINENFSLYYVCADTRYLILEDSGDYIPQIAWGIIYSYSSLQLSYSIDGVYFVGIDKADSDVRIRINDITMNLHSHVHSVATRLEVSKRWYFIEPFVGFEPSLFVSLFNTNTDSDVEISEDAGATYSKHTTFSELAEKFLQEKGLEYNDKTSEGSLRLYAGITFNVSIMYINVRLGIETHDWTPTSSVGMHLVW